jgi:hypothetical protein
MDELANKFIELKKELIIYLGSKKDKFNIYKINALKFIIVYLDELIYECKIGKLKPIRERFPHISRILIDNDPSFIETRLSENLIRAEQEYIRYR